MGFIYTARKYQVPDNKEPAVIPVHLRTLAANIDSDISQLSGSLQTALAETENLLVSNLDSIASAYDIAVKNGYSGTEQQWLESLKGPKGDPGDSGAQVATDEALAAALEQPESKSAAVMREKFAAAIYTERDIVQDYGAIGDGVADDTAAFVAAFAPDAGSAPDALTTGRTGEFINLKIPFGVYRIKPNQVTWDIYRCVVDSQQAIIMADNESADDVALTVTSTAPRLNGTSIWNTSNAPGRFSIIGSHKSRKGTGLKVTGELASEMTVKAGWKVAGQASIKNITVSHFQTGLEFGSNTYMIGLKDSAVNDVDTYIKMDKGVYNAGERIFFDNVLFGNQSSGNYFAPSEVYVDREAHGIIMDSDQSFIFNNCSFDWTHRLLRAAPNSHIFFTQCHFETPHTAMLRPDDLAAGDSYGKIGAFAQVSITQSRFLIGGGNGGSSAIPYLFDVNSWGVLAIRDSTVYARPPFVHAWANSRALLDNVTTLQAVPYESMPLPAISARSTLSPASWDMSSKDEDWSFTGGARSGEIEQGALVVHGSRTKGRLRKAVSGVANAGVSLKLSGDADFSVSVKVSVLDASGAVMAATAKTVTVGSSEVQVVRALPVSPFSAQHVGNARFVELEIANPDQPVVTRVREVCLDAWG